MNLQLRRRAGRELIAAASLQLLACCVIGYLTLIRPDNGRYDAVLPGKSWENFSVYVAGVALLTCHALVLLRRSGAGAGSRAASGGLGAAIAGHALLALCSLSMIRMVGVPEASIAARVDDAGFLVAVLLFTGGLLAFGLARRGAALRCALGLLVSLAVQGAGHQNIGIVFYALAMLALGVELATSAARPERVAARGYGGRNPSGGSARTS